MFCNGYIGKHGLETNHHRGFKNSHPIGTHGMGIGPPWAQGFENSHHMGKGVGNPNPHVELMIFIGEITF